jgi:LAS superfamily LD-carboxypeptidase LdcB
MAVKKAAKKAAAKPAEAPVAADKPKKASKYPYKKLVVPTALQGVPNGKLSGKILRPVKCGGQMYVEAAEAFDRMYDQAIQSGIKLRNVGDYRSFDAQLGLFKQRYALEDLGRKPQVTRTYEGKTWYLKPGMAPCSTPGKSNHGLGLAIDLDVTTAKVLDWLCANAPTYGFYLQSDDPSSPEFEAWHWQYCG